jgi:Predicted metal-dependent hydrolase
MGIDKLYLSRPFGETEVIVERKDVKKIRLKVLPNGVVKLSAPTGVSDQWINSYLESKTRWIEKSLNYFEETRGNEFEVNICSGASTRILGRQLRVIVDEARSFRVDQKGDHIYIQSPLYSDRQAVQKQFERWWRKQSKDYFEKVLEKLYPIIAKYGYFKPSLQVRKMKTLWGSCSRRLLKINLNYYLYRAPLPCIEYVVLHELTHFLYPKHDKDFYEFLTVHMPDWQERKRKLDHEVVKGLRF